MTAISRAVLAIALRDARIFWSSRLRLVTQLVGPIFAVVLFYELAELVSTKRFPTADAYFEFAVVGLALTPLLRSALVEPSVALREELVAGTFERLALSPLGPAAALLATLVFPFTVALGTGLVILVIADLFFGLQTQWPSALLALPLGALTALALAPLAALLLAASVVVKQVNAGTGWLVAATALVAGVYFPPDGLPGWIRWGADVQPITPALDLLRHVLSGARLDGTLAGDLGRLAAFGLVGLPLAARVLSAACALTRRRGVLLDL